MHLYFCSIILYVQLLSFSISQQTTPDGCFKMYQNVRETCLIEIERRTGITQQQCTDLCVQYYPTCKAAMFNVAKSQCDLFPAAGQMPNGKKKRSPHSGGRSRQGFNGRGGPPQNGFGGGPPRGGPPPKSSCGNTACPPNGGYRTRCDGTKPLEVNCPGNIYYVPTGSCQGGVSTNAPTASTTAKCAPLRVPQKLLVGYAETVATASSFDDCMQQCVNAQARFGFTCLSGQFYSSETSENCILNSESATTKPTLYTDETQDKVDYFEPGCVSGTGRRKRGVQNVKSDRHRSVISLKTTDWGSWTRCDGNERHRKRYKGCSSLNPNNCQSNALSCDPTNRAKEWEEIRNEEILTTSTSTTTIATTPQSTSTTSTSTTTTATTTVTVATMGVTQIVTESAPFTLSTNFVTDSGNKDENYCEPILKPDGSKDCKNGLRKTRKLVRQPCKPKIVKGVC